MNTLTRLTEWLADEANVNTRQKIHATVEADFILRKAFVTTNGITISIQMSYGHRCLPNASVEMWNCPPSPLLMLYGDGEDPYSYVPLEVVAGYIDSLETLGENHDYI